MRQNTTTAATVTGASAIPCSGSSRAISIARSIRAETRRQILLYTLLGSVARSNSLRSAFEHVTTHGWIRVQLAPLSFERNTPCERAGGVFYMTRP